VFKNNYKAWGISIGLHVVIIYFFSRQTIDIAEPATVKVVQAYVMIDLAAMPSIKSSTQPISTAIFESEGEQSVEESHAQQFKHEAKLHADTSSVMGKAITQIKPRPSSPKVENPLLKVAIDNHKAGVDQQGLEQSFKKLNPYAPIPNFTPSATATVSFDFSEQFSEKIKKTQQRITVPKEHSSSFESEILWQNADGSKRMEMYKGMCYKIDFNGVMGKVGLPQGAPRPCKDNDGILFDKIMDKWSIKKD
jgi:hypothetical protein